jgi:glycosyltransferase involved in cell wall biosynthesis
MADGNYIEDAQQSLESILRTSKEKRATATEPLVSVAEARSTPIVETDSARTKTRVLFITTDTNMLNQATKSLDGFTAIARLFHEVHIIVLRTGIAARHPILRVDTNTWLYTVTAKHRWQLPFVAWSMMAKELTFADGFRPDIVIAREVGVSAFCAYGVGRFYRRSIQLHIPERYYQSSARWERWFDSWLIRQFPSIRVTTDEAASAYNQRLGDGYDIAVLPRYRGYLSDFTGQQSTFLKTKYPQFNFIILYVGDLQTTTNAFSAIDAARSILRNPRVGFLMIGSGRGVIECERRAALLGIKDQVIIERRAIDIQAYMGSADALLVIDTNSLADEIVLYGAAAGVPTIMSTTPLREDIFVDGESAYLVSEAHSPRISELLGRLLNDNGGRLQLRERSRTALMKNLEQSERSYVDEYRGSIERALFYEAN